MQVSIATKLWLSTIAANVSMGLEETHGGKGGGDAPLALQTVGAGSVWSGLTCLGAFSDTDS